MLSHEYLLKRKEKKLQVEEVSQIHESRETFHKNYTIMNMGNETYYKK